MKKILGILGVVGASLLLWAGNFAVANPAREPLLEKLQELHGGDKKELRHRQRQIETVKTQLSGDEKLGELVPILEFLGSGLHAELQAMKIEPMKESFAAKLEFVFENFTGIKKMHTIPERCWEQRGLLDDMSFVWDLPTAVTMGTRYVETTCGRYLPVHPVYGSNGPFQIISKDYGTGEMTPELFTQTVEDFLEFSHHKHDHFEWANRRSGLVVETRYTGFTTTGVVRHGALYNGVTSDDPRGPVFGNIQPKKRWYVFNNFEEEFSGAIRHGFLPIVVLATKRELENRVPKFLSSEEIAEIVAEIEARRAEE